MKSKLLALLFLFSLSLQAQVKYFEKILSEKINMNSNSIIALNDSTFMFSGRFMIDSSLTTFHSYFASITSLGVTSEIHVFSSDTVGGDYGISEFISTDFGFAATGNISPDFIDSGISAIFLAIDPALNVANFTDIGISDVNDCGYSIAQNEESNFFIGGYYMPTFLTPLREKLYLTKVSPSGEKLWEYTNWSYPYNCSFRAVLPAPDGGCYAAGYIGYNVPSTGDFVLVKLNSNGTEVWAKIFDFDGSDFAVGLIKTPDNCLMLCGQSGIYKAHLMKVALNGDTIWNKQYFPNEDRSGFLKVASMPNNTFVAIGSIKSNDDPDMDLLITKVDSVGNIRWVRRYGSPFYHDYGYDFTPVPQPLGGFVVVGRSDTIVPTSTPGVYLTLGRGYIVKTNCMGLLTLPQAAFTISQDSNLPARFLFTNQSQYAYPDSIDGGYYHLDWGDGSPPYICGQGYEPCTQNTLTHTYQATGVYPVTLTAVVCNDTSVAVQSVCLGVEPNPQAAFTYTDFGGIIQFTNQSQNAYFEQGGYCLWDFGDGSPPVSDEHPTHTYAENGNYLVTLTLVVCADTSVYTQEVQVQTVSIQTPPFACEGGQGGELKIYPNPATNTLTFQRVSKSPLGDLGVRLLSLTGQTVLETTVATGEASKTISVAHLPAGVYFYTVQSVGGAVLARGKVAVMR